MAASVTVDFNANLARFTSSIDKATSDLSKFQTNSQRIGANVGKIFAGLGAGLSVAAFGSFIKSSIDAADKLNDLSKSTGVSVEQLSGLQLAAKQSGTDLEGVAQAINKLSINIAKDGEKFSKLGITAKDPLEAFKQLADVFVAIKDPQERAAVAAEALGKSWASAAPLLSEGGRAIGEIVEKGSKLSGITRQAAEDADKFNDQLEELKTVAGQAGLSIGSVLIPVISSAIKEFQLGVKHAGSFGGALLALGTINPFRNAQENISAYTADLAKLEKNRPAGTGNAFGNVIEQEIERTDAAIAKKKIQLGFLREAAQEEALALGKGFEQYKIPRVIEPPGTKPDTKGFLGGTGSGTGSGTDKRLEFVKSLRREVELLGATDGDKRLFDADRLGITGKALAEVKALSTRLNEYKQSLEAAKIANEDFDESFADNQKHIESIESLIGSFRKQNEQIASEADLIGATNVERETATRLRELELVGLSKYSAEWEKAGAAIKKASETSRLSTLIGDSDFSKLKQDQEDMILLEKAFTDGIEQSDGSLKKLSESEYLDTVSKRLGLAKDKVAELDDFAKNAAKNIQDAFADFLFDPFKDGLDGMLQGFGQTIKRIVAEAVAADLAKRLFGDLSKGGEGDGLVGGLFKSFGNLFSGVGGGSSTSWFDEIFAKGGVKMSPGLSAYSGQIVSKPTVFPFAHGIGLMGEAGPEAILPLQRGADGKLGVAGGASGGSTINVYVSGSNNAPDVRRAAGQGAREALAALAGAQRYV